MPIRPSERGRYPKDWPEIRERIRARAGDKCEGCGVPNHERIKRLSDDPNSWVFAFSDEEGAIDIVCTVAHLDHIPEHCDDDNLKFWCQKCHNSYDAKHRATGIRERRNALNLSLPLLAFLLLGSAVYRGPLAPAAYSRDPILQGPEAAALKTGAPAATIAGLRFAESSGRPDPAHALPSVRGAYGLDCRYHAEREAKYGSFDELEPYGAAYITARLYCDNLAALGDEGLAVTAHLYGVSGARRHGVASEYLARVRSGQ